MVSRIVEDVMIQWDLLDWSRLWIAKDWKCKLMWRKLRTKAKGIMNNYVQWVLTPMGCWRLSLRLSICNTIFSGRSHVLHGLSDSTGTGRKGICHLISTDTLQPSTALLALHVICGWQIPVSFIPSPAEPREMHVGSKQMKTNQNITLKHFEALKLNSIP